MQLLDQWCTLLVINQLYSHYNINKRLLQFVWQWNHHHWAAVVCHGWAKVSAVLQVSLSCAVLCQIMWLQYLSRSSLHRLAGLPVVFSCHNGLQLVTREVHRSSLRRLICPAQDHFIFLTFMIISMTFVDSLTQMLDFLSLEFYTCLFRQMARLLLKISRCLTFLNKWKKPIQDHERTLRLS